MNDRTLVSVHGYAGDRHQVEMLNICYQHHGCPVVIVSPTDSKIEGIPNASSVFAGLRGYIGQITWDRQVEQMERLLEFDADWFLMNDADSFCFTPELPKYLFSDDNVIYSNQVNDFRIPGGTWTDKNGSITWSKDYHKGFPLIAMQPPYFCHRNALAKMVTAGRGLIADPVTPFIDWAFVEYAVRGCVKHLPFLTGVSCETETEMGLRLVASKVREGATFIHAVKRPEAFRVLCEAYWSTLK